MVNTAQTYFIKKSLFFPSQISTIHQLQATIINLKVLILGKVDSCLGDL